MSRAIKWAAFYKCEDAYLLLNAGSNEWNFQIKELAKIVQKVISNTRVLVNPEGQPDKRSYQVKFDRFEHLSDNLLQGVSIEKTVREMYDFLKGIDFSDGNFRNSDYMRLNVLKKHQKQGLLDPDLRWMQV
jgi:hypothetical protein